MASAVSIDRAAGGYLRHAFVRAISASWLVLLVVVTLGLVASVLLSMPQTSFGGYIGYLIGMALVIAMLLGALGVAAGFFSAFLDVLHRRVLALLALCVLVPACVMAALALLGAIGDIAGFIPPDPARDASQDLQPWQNWALVGLVALGGLIAGEAVGWAWWQLTVSREGFFAARGWRPSPFRFFSAMRRLAGLPAYISVFGRGRLSLTLIYFVAAVLNLGLVALLVIPFMAFGSRETSLHTGAYLAIAMSFAALVVLNLIGAGALIAHFADARATKLYQAVREWDDRAPIVFLRSFDQDDKKLPALSRDPLVKFPAGVGSPRTLDKILLEHGACYGPVIAIGDPRDPTPPLGAARVFVSGQSNEWQHVVVSLVGAAKAVVMCPNDSQGVQWELGLISSAEGRVHVIYLANPEQAPEVNAALFARLAPAGETAPALGAKQAPIAAYRDPKLGWRVLSTAKPPCVQTYTIALNWALQALLGREGQPIRKARARRA
jgi:hypothetical protein